MERTARDGAARGVLPLAALSSALLVPGALAVVTAPDMSVAPPLGGWLAVVVVLALFITTETAQFHLEVQRFAHSVSLSDLPLVIGLFLVDPWVLAAARLAAGVVGFVLRRLALQKVLFNLSLFTAEVGLACWLLAVLAEPGDTGLRAWLAVVLVVVAVDVVGWLAVIAALTALQGPMAFAAARRSLAEVVLSGLMCAALALMFLESLEESTGAVLLLAIVALCLTAGYRAYAGLFARHEDLNTLHDASQRMATAVSPRELGAGLVEHARVVARAGGAALVPAEERGGDPVLSTSTGRTLARGTRDPDERAWLERTGHQDALIVPVNGDGSPMGTLVVTDRTGSTRTFTGEDLRRVQMLSSHAEALWANRRLLEKLRHDAYHDELTGLPNRSGFMQILADRLEALGPVGGPGATPTSPTDVDVADDDRCEAALLLFDLDRFKMVNDTLGHHVGDTLLVMVAERFRALAPPEAAVARLGGDEFAVLLPEATSRRSVRELADHVRAGIGAALDLSGTVLEISASVGMVAAPGDGRLPATLLRRADVAMYTAKRSGGTAWYRESDDENSLDRLKMLAELRKAIEDGELEVSFQPQFDLATSTIVGFEALARWRHPTRGPVSPEDFVAMAEQGGIIKMLTVSVLRQSLQHCHAWMPLLPEARVSVNLSPRLTTDPELSALVTQMLADAGVPHSRLILELTESLLMTSSDLSLANLADMRSRGVRVSVDDFGTGFSSLAYLRDMPFDEVKIDKGFVIPMLQDRGAHAIVHTVVQLGHLLDMTVVAEGIEDERTRAAVAATGCDVGQGYGLSRPIPSGHLAQWIAEWVRGEPSRQGSRDTLDNGQAAPSRLSDEGTTLRA